MDNPIIDNILNIISKIPNNIVSDLFTSGIIVSVATYYFYKVSGKSKHKQLLIMDDVARLLRLYLKVFLFLPLFIIFFILTTLNLENQVEVLGSVFLSVIIWAISMICCYIIISNKTHNIEFSKNFF
mgnify:CR=1 FL=1